MEPRTAETEWTFGRLLDWTSAFLLRQGVDEPRLSTEVLLAAAAKCRRIDLYARYNDAPDASSVERFREWVRRASAKEPIAYLVGEKEFFSLSFAVTPAVLIPRPETEALVETILDHIAARGVDTPTILDVGTGSGCIAIALLKQLPAARGVATDASSEACAVAKSNVERHGLAERLSVLQADRLAIPTGSVPVGGFHVLACNPPYIALADVEGLQESVRRFEPRMALTDGVDGLSFYRTIASDAGTLLAPDGVAALELGDGQAVAVREIMERAGGWTHSATVKDRVVGKERVAVFRRTERSEPRP